MFWRKKLGDSVVTVNTAILVHQICIIIYHEIFEVGHWCSEVQYNILVRRIEPDWRSELRYFNRWSVASYYNVHIVYIS